MHVVIQGKSCAIQLCLFILAYNRTLPDLSPSYSSVIYFCLGVEKLS